MATVTFTLRPSLIPALASIFNLICYVIVIGLAAWQLNQLINQGLELGLYNYSIVSGFITWISFVLVSLLAGVFGVASSITGLLHTYLPTVTSYAVATSAAVISTPASLLALGLSAKLVEVGDVTDGRLKSLEAFAIIIGVTQLAYTIALYLTKDLKPTAAAPVALAAIPEEV